MRFDVPLKFFSVSKVFVASAAQISMDFYMGTKFFVAPEFWTTHLTSKSNRTCFGIWKCPDITVAIQLLSASSSSLVAKQVVRTCEATKTEATRKQHWFICLLKCCGIWRRTDITVTSQLLSTVPIFQVEKQFFSTWKFKIRTEAAHKTLAFIFLRYFGIWRFTDITLTIQSLSAFPNSLVEKQVVFTYELLGTVAAHKSLGVIYLLRYFIVSC